MIRALDHVNLRTADLERAVAWYERILKLHNGARPKFGFGGAWLYVGDQAIVHLVKVETTEGANSGPLTLEHFALQATGFQEFLEFLGEEGIAYRVAELSSGPVEIVQVNIHDPDGNHIHVDFPLAEMHS